MFIQKTSQHILQYAVVFIIFYFDRRIEPALHNEFRYLSANGMNRPHIEQFLRRQIFRQSTDIKDFRTIEPQFFRIVVVGECQGHNSHANQVGAMDAFETFCDHGFYTKEISTLGSPVAR
jgi:hypothetical protein